MNQTAVPSQEFVTSQAPGQLLCLYVNVTSKLQIIRIRNIPNQCWERVIFPAQRVMFEATPAAKLEVKLNESTTVSIPCQQLRVKDFSLENKILTNLYT